MQTGGGVMPPARARAVAACVAVLVVSLAFFLCSVVALPVPLYFPLLRQFSLSGPPGQLSMDYYGRTALALVSGLCLGTVTYAGLRRLPGIPGPGAPRRLRLLLLYSATALFLCASLYGYQHFTAPLPLPEWYQAR
jgi:hypothetical protein